MLSEDKITAFLQLQQNVLDIQDSSTLLEQALPKVLAKLTAVGYSYVFLSEIFINTEQKVQQR